MFTDDKKRIENVKRLCKKYLYSEVHIALKKRWFYNGTLFKCQEDDIILNEEKLGRVYVLYDDIIRIEPRIKGWQNG